MIETQYFKNKVVLFGVDEVGRGPLAGPVVACSTMLHATTKNKLLKHGQLFANLEVGDSKQLSAKKRERILQDLTIPIAELRPKKVYDLNEFISFCIWDIGPKKIDQINIFQATMLAMKKSQEKLCSHFNIKNSVTLIDGNKSPVLKDGHECFPIIKGDSKSWLIALSSIIAKEYRDRLMRQLHLTYPLYGLDSHSGYPTKKHKAALQEFGPLQSIDKVFEEFYMKSAAKGRKFEEEFSSQVDNPNLIPLLIDVSFLRENSCGQIDLAYIEHKANRGVRIIIVELKLRSYMTRAQKSRLFNSAHYLGHIFNLSVSIKHEQKYREDEYF